MVVVPVCVFVQTSQLPVDAKCGTDAAVIEPPPIQKDRNEVEWSRSNECNIESKCYTTLWGNWENRWQEYHHDSKQASNLTIETNKRTHISERVSFDIVWLNTRTTHKTKPTEIGMVYILYFC